MESRNNAWTSISLLCSILSMICSQPPYSAPQKKGLLFLLPKFLKESTMFYLKWFLFSVAVEEH